MEGGGLFALGPVAALGHKFQLGLGEAPGRFVRISHRHQCIVRAMHNQRGARTAANWGIYTVRRPAGCNSWRCQA